MSVLIADVTTILIADVTTILIADVTTYCHVPTPSLSIAQIRDSDGQSQDPIERSESVDCPAGGQLCTASISLTSGGGIKEGQSYIVSVRAENRYGQSEETGNSNPFTIGAGGGKTTLCVHTVYMLVL